MSSSSNKGDNAPTPPDRSTVILLLADIADTTWRMFVPAGIGTIGGAVLDESYASSPLYAVIGLVLGCALTVLLIRNQLKKVSKT